MRRLTQGLDTLNGMVAGLEERLRTSLREDTNKILVSLQPSVPDSTVLIPGGTPDRLDRGETFPGFGDLAGRVTEVKDELRAKNHILKEIQVLYNRSVDTLSVQIDQASGITSPSFVKCCCFILTCVSLGDGPGS